VLHAGRHWERTIRPSHPETIAHEEGKPHGVAILSDLFFGVYPISQKAVGFKWMVGNGDKQLIPFGKGLVHPSN